MPAGQIIKWDADRGFGFIREDGARGYHGDFVHISRLPDLEPPRLGARYDFDRFTGPDGRTQAVNIREVTTWGEAAYH